MMSVTKWFNMIRKKGQHIQAGNQVSELWWVWLNDLTWLGKKGNTFKRETKCLNYDECD